MKGQMSHIIKPMMLIAAMLLIEFVTPNPGIMTNAMARTPIEAPAVFIAYNRASDTPKVRLTSPNTGIVAPMAVL